VLFSPFGELKNFCGKETWERLGPAEENLSEKDIALKEK
jgi:hypothetical protein